MEQQLIHYVRAGHPGIYLVSAEETRVESVMQSVAQSVNHPLFVWSVTTGLVDPQNGQTRNANDPLQVLELIEELPEETIVLLKDFHLFLEEGNPVLIRQLKETLRAAKAKGRTLVLLGCRCLLPPELEREFVVVEFRLPDAETLGRVLDSLADSAGQPKPDGDEREALLDAASGLTSIEAENAGALSLVETGRLCPSVIAREKAQEVRKNGLLEICDQPASLDEVGGLEGLKSWLLQRKDAFSREAREYHLPSPKGLLIIGVPGTGKSLTARATASVLQRPLLKLEAGRLFASLVGQSEANLRTVLHTVEAIAPCVLWIDELEKGLSTGTSGTDGGTSARVFGSLLSWLQDRTAPVFVVATANDVTRLPPELLRKGRFDELFFVDLPSTEEREAIWRIQITKHHRNPDDFEVAQLARATEGFTGAEIEQVFIDALHEAFSRRQEPTDLSISMVLGEVVPLSRLMRDEIAGLRAWAQGRARRATPVTDQPRGRRIQTG